MMLRNDAAPCQCKRFSYRHITDDDIPSMNSSSYFSDLFPFSPFFHISSQCNHKSKEEQYFNQDIDMMLRNDVAPCQHKPFSSRHITDEDIPSIESSYFSDFFRFFQILSQCNHKSKMKE